MAANSAHVERLKTTAECEKTMPVGNLPTDQRRPVWETTSTLSRSAIVAYRPIVGRANCHHLLARSLAVASPFANLARSGLTRRSTISKQSGYPIAFSSGQSRKWITQRLGDWSQRLFRSSPFRYGKS